MQSWTLFFYILISIRSEHRWFFLTAVSMTRRCRQDWRVERQGSRFLPHDHPFQPVLRQVHGNGREPGRKFRSAERPLRFCMRDKGVCVTSPGNLHSHHDSGKRVFNLRFWCFATSASNAGPVALSATRLGPASSSAMFELLPAGH